MLENMIFIIFICKCIIKFFILKFALLGRHKNSPPPEKFFDQAMDVRQRMATVKIKIMSGTVSNYSESAGTAVFFGKNWRKLEI
jgi:hypothetical protein